MACARKEQIRVNSREVKRTVRLLCLRSSEERLLIIMFLLQSFTLSFINLWRTSRLLGQGLPLWGSRLGRREQQFVIALIPINPNVRRSMSLRGASGKICVQIPPYLLPRGPQRGDSEVNVAKFFG
jgi:hypothetical protein